MVTREDQIPTETEPTSSTSDGADSTTGGTEPEPITPEPSAPPTPEPSVPLFQGTKIEGRSTEEGGAYIQLLEQTIVEQKNRLTEAETAPPPVAPVAAPDEEANFYDNPREVLRHEIQQAVDPINEQIAAFQAAGEAQGAWRTIEQEIPDFVQFRPMIDQLIQGHGYKQSDISVELLRNLYYTAVGWNSRHGGTPVTTPEPAPTPGPTPQHIPQHRPSTAPLPSDASTAPKDRELTENERRLAKEWNMSHGEYLRLQDENLELENYNVDKS